MRLNVLVMIFLAGFLMTSCTKVEEPTPSGTDDTSILPDFIGPIVETDYLIFGHYFGMSSYGVAIFKLDIKEEKLYKDILSDYHSAWRSDDFYKPEFKLHSQEKYEVAKDLTDYFPIELLFETENIFGWPDAIDQGGLYIEANYNGIRRFWRLDRDKRNVPKVYREFIEVLKERMEEILFG